VEGAVGAADGHPDLVAVLSRMRWIGRLKKSSRIGFLLQAVMVENWRNTLPVHEPDPHQRQAMLEAAFK